MITDQMQAQVPAMRAEVARKLAPLQHPYVPASTLRVEVADIGDLPKGFRSEIRAHGRYHGGTFAERKIWRGWKSAVSVGEPASEIERLAWRYPPFKFRDHAPPAAFLRAADMRPWPGH